mmetsp:Transcript_17358/g.32932  ORF Transcript_17358/g.32932 Transcript_17358/m.32932 type:complete len:520 (-) Transcript_17358:37-1596(-)
MNLRWMGALDMYRKVPTDLMEGTKRGSYLSLFAIGTMILLFLLETRAFLRTETVSDLALDSNKETRVRVNFNITMMDLPCRFAVIDVVSVLGTEQNVTKHVSKWDVSAEGVRQRYQGRNKEQHDIELFDPAVGDRESMEELLENGEDAVSLDADTFEYAKHKQEFLFVDFFANWCSHCRDLAPTWEVLAEVMSDVAERRVDQHEHEYSEEDYAHAKAIEMPVMIAKIDCVDHKELCQKEGIRAYPTLLLFVNGERWHGGGYRGSRTVVAMADWLRQVEDAHKEEDENAPRKIGDAHTAAKDRMGHSDDESDKEEEWAEKIKRRKSQLHHSWKESDHPGCEISGHLLMDRVPGNFHIQARSPHHDLVPHMTNVSHEVHHLSIGDPLGRSMIEKGKAKLPPAAGKKLTPMDGNAYVTHELHESYHHYLKVITTNVPGLKVGKREIKTYQIIQSSQLAFYRNDQIPEAKFSLDLSPISVSYRKTSVHWYDYLTSLMAIVGGTFTVVGLMESTINTAVSRRRY